MEQHLRETQEKNDSKVLYPAKLYLVTDKQFEHANVPFLKKLLEMNFGQVSEHIIEKGCAVRIKYIYLYNQDKPKCKNIWSGHLEMVQLIKLEGEKKKWEAN